jgi:hypothetical protein
VHFSNSPSRIASSAGGLSLAALFAVTGFASAAPLPSFAYSLSGDTLSATVIGDVRTGVWRVRMTSPAGDKRIEFVLRIGDVGWTGVVRISRRQGNSWSLVSRQRLDDALAGGPNVGGCSAGVCWNSTDLRLPRNGDARFGVTVRLTQTGSYRIRGAVREATDAFVYDSWLVSTPRFVIH